LRPDGKILVAARITAISRNRQAPPQEAKRRVDQLRRDAFDLVISADGTMRMERIAEGHPSSIETGFTLFAAPRI
jgi:hypothetical protein